MPVTKYESEIQKSIYGRRLGLDSVGHVVGVNGLRVPTEFSTASSTLANNGMSILSGSTDAWVLPAPRVAGVTKTILNASTLSTATMSVVRSTVDGFACTFLGSTEAGGGLAANGRRINLIGYGAAVNLISISSAVWAPVSNVYSTQGISYTVSTSS